MTTQPVVNEHGDEEHPSFGVVRLSRQTCRPPKRLFDSSIGHSEYVHLEIARAVRQRDLHHDSIYGSAQTLIEVDMTLTQWGALVSSFNVGSGTPVTLNRVGRESMPEAEHRSRLAETAAEVADKSRTATASVERAARALDEAFTNRAGRRDMGEAIRSLLFAVQNLPANMKFAADSLTEHAEDVVSKAKADIEAARQFGEIGALNGVRVREIEGSP